MKVVLQRVKSASVTVDGELIASIGKGVLALAAVGKDDTIKDSERSASKLLHMKLWDDENGGRWKKSVKDIDGEVLCVSQFTLYASTKKGSKPDFHKSAGADKGRELYSAFFTKVQELYGKDKVKDGIFQAMMDVQLVNDGPVSDNESLDPIGITYICEDEAVKLEIDTDPPPLDVPSEPGKFTLQGEMSVDELTEKMQQFVYNFELSPELVE